MRLVAVREAVAEHVVDSNDTPAVTLRTGSITCRCQADLAANVKTNGLFMI